MIEHHFSHFLKKFHDQRPLLLALSGGPDSMTLFHLLLNSHIFFEVAHVDHRWRASSQEEANRLADLCHKNRIPFHLKELNIHGSNLEDRCRVARLAFFKEIIGDRMQGVVLGHHAGDLVETVLKRVFEGARLTKLAGLRPVNQVDGVTLLRPLLTIPKREILAWLECHHHWYFEDETNHDPRFLRSRLRDELIPKLEAVFGKRIETSLVRLAEASLELENDVSQRLESFPSDHDHLDLSQNSPKTDFEWRMVVSNFFEKKGEIPSALTIKQIIDHLKKGRSEKVLRLKNCYVKINRRVLSIQQTE